MRPWSATATAMTFASTTLLLRRSCSSFIIRSSTRASFQARRPLYSSISTQTSESQQQQLPDDQSAAANSGAPFRAPRQSPNDSSTTTSSSSTSAWSQLGLWTELTDCLQTELQLTSPTAVQSLVLPELLRTTDGPQHVAFLAATGSGKTLAYALPVMQMLKHQEVFGDSIQRIKQRPRALVLAPTRELAAQITSVLKQLSHSIKLSVQSVTGHDSLPKQRRNLKSREVDVLVATPGRLVQHVTDGTIVLSKCKFVVLDEMDTMIEQGFSADLARLLYPILYHKNGRPDPETDPVVPTAPSVWLTSATMTQAIQKMMGDTTGESVQAKRHYAKQQQDGENNKPASSLVLPPMKVLRAPGLHKVVPKLEQVFVDVGNVDKLSLLVDLVCSSSNEQQQTLIFCNTANSCRAVEYALSEANVSCLSYHGDLNSAARAQNFQAFRDGTQLLFLVCTDLAARGLDVPSVSHVIMFDFPLNALDYLHRSGRTARGVDGRGKVTALVTKRDKVLAVAIERAVQQGQSLDGLSSRKTDYQLGGRLHQRQQQQKSGNTRQAAAKPKQIRVTAAARGSSRGSFQQQQKNKKRASVMGGQRRR